MPIEQEDLTHILQHITVLRDLPEPSSLKRLIDALRVSDGDADAANARMDELIGILRANSEYAHGLAAFILTLTSQYRQITLYTDTGILSDENFFQSLNRLIGHRFLPLLPEKDSVVELVAYLFDQKNDEAWFSAIDPAKWDELIELIKVDAEHLHLIANAKNSILNAIIVLSYRIAGMGLHPDLMKSYPQVLNYSAPFVAQNQEAVLFVNQYRSLHELDALTDTRPEHEVDAAPLFVMLEQCEDILNGVRKRIYKTGISIRLTNLLVRLEQSLARMHTLIDLLLDNTDNKRDRAVLNLTSTIALTASTRYSFGYLIENNTRLLSRKVTENASKVGEHYISTDGTGYKKMYKKAAIGGFFIGFMATLKTLSYELALAPIGRAFVNSMIYGLGFVTIHIAHGTVATKQPAMTAAAIASTISDSSGSKTQQFTKLSELVVDILRTQFVAILGNISIAMPIALMISYAWLSYYGEPMIDGKMAAHLLHDLDPIRSLAIPHAAIAGVFLFLSGLISGYYDNLAAYNKIGERINRHWLLIKLLPQKWLVRLSSFVEANLGAIMGNFIFGCFLGSTATVGNILGLPLDIRHIAFSSANFVHGVFHLARSDLSLSLVAISFLGVILIGLVNLGVSFSLALMVALRSKEVEPFEWHRLTKLIFSHFKSRPQDFFWPRSESIKYSHIDHEGKIIFVDTPEKEKVLSDAYVVRRLGKPKKKDDRADKSAKDKGDGKHEIDKSNGTPAIFDDGKKSDDGDKTSDITPLPKPDKPPQLPK